MSERKTPLTDAESKRLETQAIGWDAFEDMADFARTLERQCQEFAEASKYTMCTCDDRVCKSEQALANWKKLQEGKESK